MRTGALGNANRRAGDLGDGDYDGLLSEETRQSLADLIERNQQAAQKRQPKSTKKDQQCQPKS